eukprot:TRINITY_DN746_c0_g1_i3.p1 TRINITY_DN746_c0_g1~~TRINITY_DN746_c0_g1_i3.p1  ORF type:complete len:341 (-),score=122.75 TRINITY_DN746_c0_g1_i3:938-1960(-)
MSFDFLRNLFSWARRTLRENGRVSDSKPTRKYPRLNLDGVKHMRNHFINVSRYPDAEFYDEMNIRWGISKQQTQTWFNIHRIKTRKAEEAGKTFEFPPLRPIPQGAETTKPRQKEVESKKGQNRNTQQTKKKPPKTEQEKKEAKEQERKAKLDAKEMREFEAKEMLEEAVGVQKGHRPENETLQWIVKETGVSMKFLSKELGKMALFVDKDKGVGMDEDQVTHRVKMWFDQHPGKDDIPHVDKMALIDELKMTRRQFDKVLNQVKGEMDNKRSREEWEAEQRQVQQENEMLMEQKRKETEKEEKEKVFVEDDDEVDDLVLVYKSGQEFKKQKKGDVIVLN